LIGYKVLEIVNE